MKWLTKGLLVVLLLIIQTAYAESAQKADAVLVIKSEKRLYLMSEGKSFASFPVTFGREPKGHKQERGDERTPEGNYVLDSKNANSQFYKAIARFLSERAGQSQRSAARRGSRRRHHGSWSAEWLGVGRAGRATFLLDRRLHSAQQR